MRAAGAVGWGVSEPGGWEPRDTHTRRAHDPPVSVAEAPNLLPTPGPPAPLSWFSPLAGPGMPKNGVTGVQSPGQWWLLGRTLLTAHTGSLSSRGGLAEKRSARTQKFSRCKLPRSLQKKGGETADSQQHRDVLRAIECGHVRRARGSCRGGLSVISGPVQKVSTDPYFNRTTFLPLFAFSALGAQGRAERARVVLGSSKRRARDEVSC